MESLESPLNLAHIESRKADRYQTTNKWDESITCHIKAIGLLAEAESLTQDKHVLESLMLQRQSHTRQVELLTHRKEVDSFISKYKSISGTTIHYTEDLPNIGELRLNDIPSTHDVGASSESDNDGILKTIVECDSLLHILNRRTRPSGNNSAVELARSHSGTKIPKDQHEFMEELKTQNDELRLHVLNLLQEADNQQSEILSLQNENAHLQSRLYILQSRNGKDIPDEEKLQNDSETESPEEEEDYFLNSELASLDLPPLEIPQFEFSNNNNKQNSD